MNRTLSLLTAAALLGGLPHAASAQTPGSPDLVKFAKVAAPVPAQKAQGGNPAGEFYHATYTGAAWGDYDGDGALDLWYSDMNPMIDSHVIYSNLYHNQGDATFARMSIAPFASLAFSCPVWLDANADGRLDLFVSGIAQWDYGWRDAGTPVQALRAYLYLGNGDGTFERVDDHGVAPLFGGLTGGKAHNWTAAGDIDGDGLTDLAIAGFDDVARMAEQHPEEALRVVRLYRNVDGRHFQLIDAPLEGGQQLHGLTDGSVVLSDLDGDGALDLLTTGYGHTRNAEAYVYWNRGNGTFVPGDALPTLPLTDGSSSVADLDGDGRPDVVLTGVYSDTGRKHFAICRNLGSRKFALVEGLDLEGIDGGQLAFGDVNNDGLTDMLVGGHGATHEHTTWLYLNQGDFNFAVHGAYYNDPFGKLGSFARVTHGSHHLVDVDNDGRLDAWFSGWCSGTCSRGCATQLWRNESNVAANQLPAPPRGLGASTADDGTHVVLHWQQATAAETPQQALRYNIYVREKGTGHMMALIPADAATGRLKVNALTTALNTCIYRIGLTPGRTYEWGVQTIDGAGAASAFATGEFTHQSSAVTTIEASAALQLEPAPGGIRYRVDSPVHLTVYNPAGSVLAAAGVQGEGLLPLEACGIVIVSAAGANQRLCRKIVL